ncbi:MAG TPA: STAS domain-containing protein [Anaerolineales bacterium]|nr:STAS domain-containing protein [Anaerolineales bacterium]
MDSNFRISSEQIQTDVPVTVFHIYGWLDAQSEEELLAAARTAYDDGARYLLIDMHGLETLTTAGLRALQKVYRIFTPKDELAKKAHLKLCNAPQQIYHVLGITGFLETIHMYESIETALQSFEKE